MRIFTQNTNERLSWRYLFTRMRCLDNFVYIPMHVCVYICTYIYSSLAASDPRWCQKHLKIVSDATKQTLQKKKTKNCSCATFASRSGSCKAWTHDKFCCGKTSLQLLYLQVEMLWWGIRRNSGCLMLFGHSILMVPRGPRYSSKPSATQPKLAFYHCRGASSQRTPRTEQQPAPGSGMETPEPCPQQLWLSSHKPCLQFLQQASGDSMRHVNNCTRCRSHSMCHQGHGLISGNFLLQTSPEKGLFHRRRPCLGSWLEAAGLPFLLKRLGFLRVPALFKGTACLAFTGVFASCLAS